MPGSELELTVSRLARSLRQQLELYSGSGWKPPVRPVSPPPEPPRRQRPAATIAPAPRVRPPPAALPRRDPDGDGERTRREALLAPLRDEVASCTRCGLCKERTQTVFGVGDPCARLMFVGEAPGFDEDRQGEPFVGRAGQLLNDIIRAMRLRREDVFIANVVKCRPPRNRNPDVEEISSCTPFLRRQIEVVSPQVICALGAVAARTLLQTSSGLGALRGRFHDYAGIPVRVTYHPAYLLRNPEDKRKTWEDVQSIMQHLAVP